MPNFIPSTLQINAEIVRLDDANVRMKHPLILDQIGHGNPQSLGNAAQNQ